MIDPYDILGIARDADEDQVRAAFRKLAKASHPDSGGNTERFIEAQKASELLLDPIRRKFFDETGYDPQFADQMDLQGLMVIDKLVNDIVLDEREPGSFDPIAGMQAKIDEENRKAKFRRRELQSHQARIQNHLDRFAARPENDVLGHMLKARVAAIARLVDEATARIEATERAHRMLDAYSYRLNEAEGSPLKSAAVSG